MRFHGRRRQVYAVVLLSLSVASILAVASGCGKTPVAAQPPSQPAEQRTASVSVIKPEKKTLRRVIKQPGTVEAFQETLVYAKIPGYVQKVYRDIDDRVRGPRYNAAGKLVEPGEVLAELSVPELEEELRQEEALVVQADAEVEQAKAAVETALAQIESAKSLVKEMEAGRARVQATYERWHLEDKRFDEMALQKVITSSAREEQRNQLRASDAARGEQEAKIDSAKAAERESVAKHRKAIADQKAAEARVKVAKAKEGRSRALLEYSQIRAPFSGIVTRRFVNEEQFVQPATGAGAQPLFVVVQSDRVRVFTKIPEVDALFIKNGMKARIQPLVIKDQDFSGTVTRTSWSLHATERTLNTEIDLPNPAEKLRPGMYVTAVTIVAELPDRFTLPPAAVAGQGDQTHCFVVEDGKLVRTLVRIGLQDANWVEVLKKAKSPKQGDEPQWENFTGEEAVVQGHLSALTDGQTVIVAPAGK
jgi:multidrug efflux pump subunit AcrA (membrane-fusion protein)